MHKGVVILSQSFTGKSPSSIVNNVAMYEAQLTRKSLSNQVGHSPCDLEPFEESVWGNLLPSHEIADHMDFNSY